LDAFAVKLFWWRVSCSTARELFLRTHTSTPSTRLVRRNYHCWSLRYGPTGNRTQPANFGGACSNNCLT